MEISILQGGKYGIRFYPSHWPQQDGGEVPRFLFLGMCLVFHYPVVWVMFPKLGLHLGRRTVAQALMKP